MINKNLSRMSKKEGTQEEGGKDKQEKIALAWEGKGTRQGKEGSDGQSLSCSGRAEGCAFKTSPFIGVTTRAHRPVRHGRREPHHATPW